MQADVGIEEQTLTKGPLYAIIAILLVAVVGGGLYLYREETKPGIELKADENGVSIQKN